MILHLLTGVFGNAPTNPVLFGLTFAGMAIGYGVRHFFGGIFHKKKP